MKKLSFLFLGLLTLFVAWSFYPRTKPNVLVVLIDTLRADHLGYMGYERDTSPFIDSFAAENLNFSRAISSASWTPPAVASLFSGNYAAVHGHMPLRSQTEYGKRFTRLDKDFITLAESFKAAGYDTGAISANPIVGERYGLSQGFDLFVSPGRESADRVNERAKKYLTDLRSKEKPFFLYLHYMEPHDPYEPPAPYDTMFTGTLKAREYPAEQSELINKYDGEIRFVDEKIKELFSWLKKNDLYDETVVLLLADHGEQFLERGYQGHADRTYSEEIHIPFILKVGGLKGTETTPVSIIDVYPTLLDAAGIKNIPAVQGISLLSRLDERKKEGVFAEIIRHVNEKAYLSPSGDKLINEYLMEKGLIVPPEELLSDEILKSSRVFNLADDPFEINPVDDEALKKMLGEAFLNLYRRTLAIKSFHKTGEVELNDKEIEQLKSLGYL